MGIPLAAMLLLVGAASATLVAGQDARGTNHFDHDHANQDLTAVDLSPDPDTGTPSILTRADFSDSILDGADLTGVVGGCQDPATVLDCTAFQRTRLVLAILRDAELALSSFDQAVLTHAVLSGADLSGASFDSADLSSADLRGADLTGASAVGVVLDSAILDDSVWQNADLTGADFRFAQGGDADFGGAILQQAVLEFAFLSGTDLTGADLTGLLGAYANLRGSDLTGVDASNADFTSAALPDTIWIDAILHDADFSEADLSGADGRCADSVLDPPADPPASATCAEFHGTTLQYAVLGDGLFQYAQFVASATGPVDLAHADLLRADFSDACFTTLVAGVCQSTPPAPMDPVASLVDVELSGARFDRATMTGVDLAFTEGTCVNATPGDPDQSTRCPSFIATDLFGADLRQARIFGGVFTEADLGGADLTGAFLNDMTSPCTVPVTATDPPRCLDFGQPGSPATLVAVHFEGADVGGLDFAGLDLTGADFGGADAYTSLDLSDDDGPFTVEYTTSFAGSVLRDARFDAADLQNADFAGADLTGVDFASADMKGVDFSQVQMLSGAAFDSVDLSCTAVGPCDRFPIADLSAASFVGATLTSIVLDGKDLRDADFSSAALASATFAGADVSRADFASADLTGALFGTADLTDANFSLATLTDADFATVTGLAGARFDSTTLTCAATGPCVRFPAISLARTSFVGATLSSLVLSGRNLDRANFTGALLDSADLSDSTLTNVKFANANLSNALFGTADLTRASFASANLTGADLDQVTSLQEAVFDSVDLQCGVAGACDRFPVAALDGASFKGANLTSFVLRDRSLMETDFTGAALSGADFSNSNLDGARFTGATLTDAAFGAADLTGASFESATLTDADFSLVTTMAGTRFDFADLQCTTGTPCDRFPLADLQMTSFVGANLTGFVLSGRVLDGVDFSGAILTGADLTDAMLAGADFSAASLANVRFGAADLTGVSFSNANVSGADFAQVTQLSGTRFDFVDLQCTAAGDCDRFPVADLQGTSFLGADLTELDLIARDLAGVAFTGANLTNANLAGSMLGGADFTNATLTNVDFGTADLTGVSFENAGVTGADFTLVTMLSGAIFDQVDLGCSAPGPCNRLPVADLQGTSFVGAGLGEFVLVGRDLAGIDFSQAVLGGANLSGSMLAGADFSDAALSSVVFDDADLMDVAFGAADLSSASFENANVTGADFTLVTSLTGAVFDQVDLRCSAPGPCDRFPVADLQGASFVAADLSEVVLAGRDLSDVDFTGATLVAADLSGAVLDAVDFTGSDLGAADLTSATFAGATFAANGDTVIDAGKGTCTPGPGELAVVLNGAALAGANFGSAVNFQEGCIVVDATTTYDSTTTVFPDGFTLQGQMTDVPEPAAGWLQLGAIGAIGWLSRRHAGQGRRG